MELIIFQVIILIFSVIIHEVSHGYAALWLGDPTAQMEGRLTLNPVKHLDPFGSVILPGLLALLQAGFIIGWAKPVPYNPYNLRNRRWGEAIVAAAGPLSNLLLAFIFGMIIRFDQVLGLSSSVTDIAFLIVLTNVVLAVFNLMPFPPLDGSKILFALLPEQYARLRVMLEQAGFILIFVFIFFIWKFLSSVIAFVVWLFVGS